MAFNSREYEHADITVLIGGRDTTGLRAIKYKEKAEREAMFAKGRFAHSIQTGNIAYEGEVVMLQSDYLALRTSGNGSVLNLNLDIIVSFGNPQSGDTMVTDRLEGCRFGESEMGMKQGEKFMEVTLPFMFLKLVSNV